METVAINNHNDFALWAIECAKEIMANEGTALVLAAQNANEDALRATANALGQAITQAMLEVFDGLLPSD